ncbi:MAG: leucine-rich repeat domain-containing protein [Bacteroidales bacterium]|nr:leucine-rich repeat domain-containing protein [Bacteroidales bacterium]
MKKFILCIATVFLALAVWGQGKDGLIFQSGKLFYKIKGKTVYVTKEVQGKYSGRLEVPAKVTHQGVEYTVTQIDDGAFSYQDELVEVVLPKTIKQIRKEAFAHCKKLERIIVPVSVTRIVDGAFSYCPSLTTLQMAGENERYLTLPGSNAIFEKAGSSYGTVLFAACKTTKLPTSGVKVIGPKSFTGCPLTSITVPAGYETISPNAFKDCTGLTKVDLPKSIRYVDSSAFEGCVKLSEIRIPKATEPDDFNSIKGSPAKVIRY